MSTYGDPETRTRVLDAALNVASEMGPAMRLADVCRAAGISHQGLYLHFGGRDGLLLAMLPHMVERFGMRERHEEVVAAPSGLDALRRMVAFQGHLNERLDTIGWVLEEAQHLDDDFGADWRRRVSGLGQSIENDVIRRLSEEGQLRADLSVSDATDLFLAATTFGSWRDMTREVGRTPQHWVTDMQRILEAALRGPERP